MRRFAVAAIGTLAGFGIAVACGDPYEGDIPTPAPDRDADTAADAASDVAAVTDAAVDVVDAADAADATTSCDDVDNDGFVSVDCDGGTDCDDGDPRANPDAGYRTALPTAKTAGDWNCDGKLDAERRVNLTCSSFSDGLAGTCATIEGFKKSPACGEAGDYVKCKVTIAFGPCAEGAIEQRIQGCK